MERKNILHSVKARAMDIRYESPHFHTYSLPSYYATLSVEDCKQLHKANKFSLEGSGVLPPPLFRFVDLKMPPFVYTFLKEKGIQSPTAIQQAAFPLLLLGRDVIGLSTTGSGKT